MSLLPGVPEPFSIGSGLQELGQTPVPPLYTSLGSVAAADFSEPPGLLKSSEWMGCIQPWRVRWTGLQPQGREQP